MEGYVYVLSNPSMPGLMKIGRSTYGGKKRAKSLYQTGVPERFILEFEMYVEDCIYIEERAHEILWQERHNESREFFAVSKHEAIEAVMLAYLDEIDRAICGSDESSMLMSIKSRAHDIDVVWLNLGESLLFVDDDILLKAHNEYVEHMNKIRRKYDAA